MSSRNRVERGAAMVEMAIALPIVFLVLFTIFDYGIVFRDQLTLQDAVADAARAGSIMGPDVTDLGGNGDYEIISALREGLGSIQTDKIERIVIFNAPSAFTGSPEDQVPAGCLVDGSTGVNGQCNVYPVFDALFAAQESNYDYFKCSETPTSPACHWKPEDRDDGPSPDAIEYVGVYVELETTRFVGIIGVTEVSRASIARLEPGEVQL